MPAARAPCLPALRTAEQRPPTGGAERQTGPRRPARHQTGTGQTGPGSDLTSRLRVYRAIRRLLEDLAAPDGLVLILDDVHWADSASVELLDHLVRHPPRGRVLIAIAYRPAQASAAASGLARLGRGARPRGASGAAEASPRPRNCWARR